MSDRFIIRFENGMPKGTAQQKRYNGATHTYFKDKKTFVEFRLETTRDTFEQMDFEFKDILGTIK